MNQAVVNLHVDFEGLHPIDDKDETKSDELLHKTHYERLTSSSQFCSKIQRHFDGIWTHKENLESYLAVLDSCHWTSSGKADDDSSILQPIVERSISQYNYSIRHPFTRMENNFYNTFYKHIIAGESNAGGGSGSGGGSETNSSKAGSTSPMIPNVASTPLPPNLDLVASALLSNARTTLQAAIVGIYYAEKNRWVHANQDCLSQVIPQSIVTRSKFNATISKIEKTLEQAATAYYSSNAKSLELTYDLAISRGSIAKYYSLPLTDCSHTSSGSLVVRILVPILKKDRAKTMQLVHVHNLPFQYKDHVCRLRLNPTENHSNSHGGLFDDLFNGGGGSNGFFQQLHGSHHYLYEELSRLAFPTDCKGNELCKISEYALNPRNADPCVSALLSKNYQSIQKSCHFHCAKMADDSSHGGGGSSGSPIVTRIHSNAYVLTGSPMQLKIRCKGQPKEQTINVVNEELYGSLWIDLPCKCQMVVDNRNIFHGEGPCSNVTELRVFPIIPFHFGRMKPKGSNSNAATGEKNEFYYENLQEGTFVNLADYFDDERADGYLKSAAERRQKAEAAKLISSGGGADGEGGNGSASVICLWIVFIITVIILLSIQAYILYLLRRDYRVNYAKDERILYKVPDSPTL
jgi:hypothetical protein